MAIIKSGSSTDQLTVDPTSKAARATLYDSAGNKITSQASGSQLALDVGVNVAGVQVDPRQIRTLTTADTVTANTVPVDGTRATYSASCADLAVAASATDILTISGSATKTVRITRVSINGIQTTAGSITVRLIKRGTPSTAGTSTNPTVVPHDSSSSAGTAVVNAYTANPTLGSLIGVIAAKRVIFPAAASVADTIDYNFYECLRPAQAIVLRGTSQVLAVSFNGVTVTGGSVNICLEFTEE